MHSHPYSQLPTLGGNRLDRAHLRAQVVQALEAHRLVMLVAPAGFGKTALLVQALGDLPPKTALTWLRCDPDDTLERFIDNLVGVLEPFDLPWQVAPEALRTIAGQDGGPARAAAELVHGLSYAEAPRGVLAFDDLHGVTDSRVFELLEHLIASLPPGWTVAISSRTAPRMKLSRLWIQGAVAEFGQKELRFTPDETVHLLQIFEPEASAPDMLQAHELLAARAERLVHETGGWIAGICLSLLAGTDSSASAAQRRGRRHMFEYLASEVLGGMPQDLRDFLVTCSVLPELSASRCEALTGNPRAAAFLRAIDGAGLFVTVTSQAPLTLTLHDLFRSFLEDQLRDERPDELPLLLARAAETETDLIRRIELLLQAGAWERVEDVITEAAMSLSIAEIPDLLREAERFPPAIRDRSPAMAYMRGLQSWPLMVTEPMRTHMAAAVEGFEARQQPTLAARARCYQALASFHCGRIEECEILGQAGREKPDGADREVLILDELLRYCMASLKGPAEAPARHLRRLTKLLPGAPAELWFRCMLSLAVFDLRPGVQGAVAQLVKEGLRVAGDAHPHLRAAVQLQQLLAAVVTGQVDEARELAVRVEEDMTWLASAFRRRLSYIELYLAAIEGQRPLDGIRTLVTSVLALPEPRPALARNASVYLIRLAASFGDWDFVREMMPVLLKQSPFPEAPHLRFPPEALLARIRLHDGDGETACQLLEPLLPGLSDIDHHGNEDFIRLTLAAARVQCGRLAAAWEALCPVIDAVAEHGHVSRLVFSASDLAAELAVVPWGSHADPARLARLVGWVADFNDGTRAAPAKAPAAPRAPAAVLEALTAREVEVLERLAAGDSNKVIGRTLEVSPNTVKRHVARILSRLGVNSRGEAASWYRRQGGWQSPSPATRGN